MIKIESIILNPFGVNAYIIYDDSKEAVLVDPACYTKAEEDLYSDFIEKLELKPVAVINTHGHIDHIFGNQYIKDKYNIPVYMHSADKFLVQTALAHAQLYGFKIEQPPLPDFYLDDEKSFKFGNSELQLLHIPGHSPGSIALYSEEGSFVVTGDVLFAGSIGRTDLPKGNYHALIHNIKTKLFILPDNTIVFPGHMDDSSIGYEKMHNPYFMD
ncbi:MAG: MBL fold metallo-hydrolase [Bacteroidales bacterium]|nr:MBL fold metallo-hydrolase [Bacteroidales bacterium]